MNGKTFNSVVKQQLDRCTSILASKGAEYTLNDDKLMNIRLAAHMQQVTMKQALQGQMCKHTASIAKMIKSDEDASLDVWTEKITDHINYLLLLKAIVVEEKGLSNENT